MVSEAQERVPTKYKKRELMLLLFPLIKKILSRFRRPWKQAANQKHPMFVMQKSSFEKTDFYQGERTYEKGFDR